ncbi:pyridoxamine 5'-phosphate oxidase family protein [Pseudonocardia sp. WMMC193]|uniref:pyridoxamine 5'-phosphate oxidase family protein n=1 Tax=Pseudonocardia sp. WMMC193 TaxID=2911965 RepID=UPI001F1E9A61|nr:pyridoxamine 5'-phosphate oxidase family protein [Pseudonocardia sp. WMMC193]MCF7551644.1 pyridoxamine 5'-phosphate oxidase family protein [Pseudonocardia sp. WMMC193]
MLTDEDRDLLSRPLHGYLTVAPRPGARPVTRPVWFGLTDAGVEVFSLARSPKVRRVQEDPWASLVVAAPEGEAERWVAVSGVVTVQTEGAADLARDLAATYWDLAEPDKAAALAAMVAEPLVRLVIAPDDVRRGA